VSGAAPLSVETISAFRKGFGVDILEGYGLTETSPVATINPFQKPKPGTVGIPLGGVHVKIVDEAETVLPTGQEGEVCIQGPNVMKGYFNKPNETKETFTRDGWFKTGDMGALDAEGYLSLRGRKKDMIIVKGLKVFAAQVEQVLAASPLIEEVAVIGIPDDSGNEIIKAFIVLKQGVAPDTHAKSALMQFCRDHLDTYKRPRDIEFIDALPKNSLQKVLKRVLLKQELEKRR
jgi:long-chain acyl-CoA synthetase